VTLQFHQLLCGLISDGAVGDTGQLPKAVVGRCTVQMEEGGIKFATDLEAALFVPSKWRANTPAIARKRFQIPRRIDQLKDPRDYPGG
jgi:hypothetical protein